MYIHIYTYVYVYRLKTLQGLFTFLMTQPPRLCSLAPQRVDAAAPPLRLPGDCQMTEARAKEKSIVRSPDCPFDVP